MGLQSTIQSIVGTAFDAIGDLKERVDYIHEGQEPDYDPTTGSVTSDVATVSLEVRATLVPFSSKMERMMPSDLVEIALPGDYVALIPGVDMTREPTTADRLVRLDETWTVMGFTRDPAKGLWKVLIRRLGGGSDGEVVFHE